MQAIIISIGDELALGQTVDTNAAWLSAKLAERGIGTQKHITVADERAAIADAIGDASHDADWVIITGGLGPTEDDLTRFAIADAMGVQLSMHEPSLDAIGAFFAQRGRKMVDRNKVQAMCPVGARMLDNPVGTAPGIAAEIDRAMVFSTPGVPHEMRHMWDRHIAPALPELTGRVILTTRINTFGTGESDVAEMLGDLMARDRNPKVGTTAAAGIIGVRLRSEFADHAEARRQLDATIAEVEAKLGSLVFGRDDQTLADALGAALTERGQTMVAAESCTGGLVGKLITDSPGASGYFLGSYVTYAYAMKERLLGVPNDVLTSHGAVSERVALHMVEGALDRSGADHAVAITGIAGPEGGSDAKPVGTVWFAVASADGTKTVAEQRVLPGDRTAVRQRAAMYALNLLRLRLLDARP